MLISYWRKSSPHSNHHQENRSWCELHRTVPAGAALPWLPFPFPGGGSGLADAGSGTMLEAGRSRMALHPEIDAALRKEDEERGRAEGELFSQGRAKKWKSLRDRHSPHSVLGHSQALQGTTQAETAPGLPLQLQFKVAEGNPQGAA